MERRSENETDSLCTETEEEDEEDEVEEEEEELDPRIQSELERLNRASQEINNLELSMEDARSKFRSSLNDSTTSLDALGRKLGTCVEKARPYYQARMNARTIQADTQKSALRYERACSMHAAAKEMVNVAEQGFLTKGQQFDTAWQEMLNHATSRVNEAETEIMESELEHAEMTFIFHKSEQIVKKLQREHRRSINKSRPYFEMKGEFNRIMEEQKKRVEELQEQLRIQKTIYSCALKTLERISDEIHAAREKRRARHALGKRVSGVGAEDPDPSPEEERIFASESEAGVSNPDQVDFRPVKPSVDIENPVKIGRDFKPSSRSPVKRSSQSPGKDTSSVILSVGALQDALPSLPYTKVTVKKSKSPVRMPYPSSRVSESREDSIEEAVVKETEVKDVVARDSVSLDSEDLHDTDSDSSSLNVPDDDMVADALNDFAEDFEEELEEKFKTLPANLNFTDLKTFFRQGELKKWANRSDLH